MHEDLLKILLAPALDDRRARDDACNERKYHKEHYTQQQRVVGYFNAAHSQKQGHDGSKGHEDDEVVDSHLNECIGRIAAREVAPYEYHGRAGSGSQEHSTGQILVGQASGNPLLEDHKEEEPRDGKHRERLDEPVDHTRHKQTFRVLGYVLYTLEVHLHHHRVDHHPDEDGHGNTHVGILKPREHVWNGGQELAHRNANNNT